MRQPLPIDGCLPAIAEALHEHRGAVVIATPGAGKSTRVPVLTLDTLGRDRGEVLVLEPRRLAARLLAERVASELGEAVGGTVGYAMRFEHAGGADTRIRFLTEGVLIRRLAKDPSLRGVSAVILDELHERHVDTDVALATVARLRRGPRPELVAVAMSATLAAGPVASLLGVPVLEAEGRLFPVELRHAERSSEEPLERQVARALAEVLGELEGDILVFLPGMTEIRRTERACARLAERHGLAVLPLHGSLPRAEQDRALRPSAGRKVILATNVAETSITIEGVSIVIDSGLVRTASVTSRGVPTVRVSPISRASAAQRAGRAGRTGPGLCVRLYTRGSFAARPDATPPEILLADLAPTVLALAAMNTAPEELPWLDAPRPEALAAARALLVRLGALDEAGLCPVGRRMMDLPLAPRVARVLVRAEELGIPSLGAWVAAALSEGSPFTARDGAGVATRSDILDWADALERSGTLRGLLDPSVVRSATRTHAALARRGGRSSGEQALSLADRETCALRAILAGFPDRVGRLTRRPDRAEPELALAQGGSATLARESHVQADLVVAVELEQREHALVRAASSIEGDWLLLDRTEEVTETTELVVEPSGRVVEVARLSFGALILEEKRGPPRDPDAAARAAASALLGRSSELLRTDTVLALRGRLAFARAHAPDAGLPEPTEGLFHAALAREAARGAVLASRPLDLAALVLAALDGRARGELDRLAPVDLVLPSGRRARIEYPTDGQPSIAARMQDLFGLVETPRVAAGRAPVVLELLAPNGRPVQVTTDLAGFWIKHYPALAKELRRRYPRHPFPEDPAHATPPAPRRR